MACPWKSLMHEWRSVKQLRGQKMIGGHLAITYPSVRRHEDSDLRLLGWLHHWSNVDFLWHPNNLVLVPDWSGFDLCLLHTALLLACTLLTCSPTGFGVGKDMSQRTNVGALQHVIFSKLISWTYYLIMSKKRAAYYIMKYHKTW